jgi:hypothetical protein
LELNPDTFIVENIKNNGTAAHFHGNDKLFIGVMPEIRYRASSGFDEIFPNKGQLAFGNGKTHSGKSSSKR